MMEVLYDFGKIISGIAIDAEDNIFVANYGNKTIDKVSLNNDKVSITQSKNTSSPRRLAINSKNEIYIGEGNGKIMKMTKEGIISNIAGDGTLGFVDGIGKSAKIGFVEGILFDENDTAYFCDYYDKNASIRKLTLDGKVTTICGGEEGYSDGKGKQAKFDHPTGIVYNPSTKLFYITDHDNKSIRTMTVDGNVNTLFKYSDNLQSIAIDGEGKLYVSTAKNSSGEGELITVDTKGEIKQMNIGVKDCKGMAFNSKGDLFFTSDNKLSVIRNCTKYPPRPILAPVTYVNTKELDVQSTNIVLQLKTEIQELRKQLAATEAEKQRLSNDLNSLKIKLQEFEQKRVNFKIPRCQLFTDQQNGNEVMEWLKSFQLESIFSVLQDLGAKNLEYVKLIEASDIEGLNIKPLEKRMLIQSIKKLREDFAIKSKSTKIR